MVECYFRIEIEYIRNNGTSRTVVKKKIPISGITKFFSDITSDNKFVSFERITVDEITNSQFEFPSFCEDSPYFYISDNEENDEKC